MNIDFLSTPSYKCIKIFINDIVSSIQKDKQIENNNIINILENIYNIIYSVPLSNEKGRYANPNSKDVFNKILEVDVTSFFDFNINSTLDINNLLELNKYLHNSFGNNKRLDYGTGHELNFLCFCYVAYKFNVLSINEIYLVFKQYWRISKYFINKFNLEPAGSKGSWSLDDYQLLPFVFGVAENGDFFHNLRLINKSVVLLQLRNIDDYIKMYDREVLRRHVVTKSFIYGKYLIQY